MEATGEVLLFAEVLVPKEISDKRKVFLLVQRIQIADIVQLFADQKTIGRSAIANLLNLPPDPDRRFSLEILDIISLTSDSALVDAHWFRETSPKPKGRVQY